MNVARKSTTKLPQNWPAAHPKEDETDSGLGSADAAEFREAAKESFQEVLFNIKALNGGTESISPEEPDKQAEDENKDLSAPPVQHEEKEKGDSECDILDQIDSIVNDDKAYNEQKENGTCSSTPDEGGDARASESEEDDVVMLIDSDAKLSDDKQEVIDPDLTEEKSSDSKDQDASKGPADGGDPSKEQTEGVSDASDVDRKNAAGKRKHPLQIGARVRNTFHNIMSKLVQSGNPELNNLITKTKSEDSQDSVSSATADVEILPAPAQQTGPGNKGNLFDNLDFCDSRSPKASPVAKTKELDNDSKSSEAASTSNPNDEDISSDTTANQNAETTKEEKVDVIIPGDSETCEAKTEGSQNGLTENVENNHEHVEGTSPKKEEGKSSALDQSADPTASDDDAKEKKVEDGVDGEKVCVENGSDSDNGTVSKVCVLNPEDKSKVEVPDDEEKGSQQTDGTKCATPTDSMDTMDSDPKTEEKPPDQTDPAEQKQPPDQTDPAEQKPLCDNSSEASGAVPSEVGDGEGEMDTSSANAVSAKPADHDCAVVSVEPMDTADTTDTPQNGSRASSPARKSLGSEDPKKLTDSDRKRQHESESNTDSDGSQVPKRSRLDEVIGKLGERVIVPSDGEENDSCDNENDNDNDLNELDDSESVEKQSEEVSETASASASVSDDEEERNSGTSSNSKVIRLTAKELEALVRSKVKAYMAQQQVAELRTLRLRVVELQEAQDEWRDKAKKLERQVLDLTVLQQRLEKRKAHTAALRSITTRNFGVQVSEDKLRSTTPQKNAPPRTPPAVPGPGGAATPQANPGNNMPPMIWTSGGLFGTPAVLAASSGTVSSPSGNKVTTITIGGNMGSRNTSVAQLLSHTARMPTAASAGGVTSASTAKPPLPQSLNVGFKPQSAGMHMQIPGAARNHSLLDARSTVGAAAAAGTKVGAANAPPASSLVMLNGPPASIPAPSKGGAVPGSAMISNPPGGQPNSIKFIDLTMEDDAGQAKQPVKQMSTPTGQVRGMVPQQVVRQISPLSQGVPGSTSTILLSPGTPLVPQTLARPPGMYQVVTIANTQQLRPGSLVTVMPGQPGLVRQAAPTTSLVSAVPRPGQPPQLLTQVPPGMTLVRPGSSVLPPAAAAPAVAPMAVATNATRMPVTLTTLPSTAVSAAAAAVTQPDPVPSRTAPKVHPAPPPPAIIRNVPAETKPVPPRPGLKISRVKQGIVLSWNMTLPSDCIEISSYQLYAYQETSAPASTSLWKKVGDVKALPLPMACTLTQFQDGNKYHFAVRAIDKHGRSGLFSDPAFIFLSKPAS